MKVGDKLSQREPGEVSFSFEYFCPKTEQGLFNLINRIDQMAKLSPLFVDITWNAGGSTSSDTTLELIEVCEKEVNMDTCMHMTCAGMSEKEVDSAISSAYDAGCRTILALRGDPPQNRADEEDKDAPVSQFAYAKDLISHIRARYGNEMSIGVAGYPEGHPEESDPAKLIQYLKEKVDAGADFIVTQMFYDVDLFVQWHQQVRAAGINVPIIPGIMPVSGWASFLRRARWCQINLPERWVSELEPLSHDDAAVRQRGTELVAELCTDLMRRTDVDHLHFYTMNLEKSPVMCLDALNLVSSRAGSSESVTTGDVGAAISGAASSSAIDTSSAVDTTSDAGVQASGFPRTTSRLRRRSILSSVKPIHWRNRPKSYIDRTASWDEFPNGRWGDSSSPAFNNLNELEALLKVPSATARQRWGHPQSAKDVGQIVINYLSGKLGSLPWSESPAADEASAISADLQYINSGEREWFSINSQPAVNGISSKDHVFGWGPSHGYVYQKAYLELLVDPELWEQKLKPRLEQLEPTEATYYAVGSGEQAELITNAGPDTINAITWGIFPGKEVVQPTIVEGTSFMAWKEEAFRIAAEWSRCYPVDSEPYKFLQGVSRNWVLVNIVHHDYPNPHALFEIMRSI